MHNLLRLRPPLQLAEALATLEDSELQRLTTATEAEAQRRSSDRQRWTPARLFKSIGAGAALLGLLLSSGGCASGYLLYKYATAATVTYRDPAAFACASHSIPNSRGALETCSRCQNISAVTQEATLSTHPEGPVALAPGASVILCQDRASVLAANTR